MGLVDGVPAARALLALVSVSVFAAACGGGGKDAAGPTPRPSRTFTFSPGEGKLIRIGDGRSLNLVCAGSGAPTIVVAGDDVDRSSEVRDDLAPTTRICAYDPPGIGYSSDPARTRFDSRAELQDLEALLRAAHLPAPYVLVGNINWSPTVSMFAEAHPAQTAGVVLLEGVGANFRSRFLALGRGEPARVQRHVRRAVGPRVAGAMDWSALGAAAASVKTLGRIPIGVVSTSLVPLDSRQPLPARVRRAAVHLNLTMEDELAALSSNHVHVVATHASDYPLDEAPQVIATMLGAVVRAARDRTPLPPCQRLFHRPDVRCRS